MQVTRFVIAVALGLLMVLPGCTGSGAAPNPLKQLNDARLEKKIARQAEDDPFPTADSAGL